MNLNNELEEGPWNMTLKHDLEERTWRNNFKKELEEGTWKRLKQELDTGTLRSNLNNELETGTWRMSLKKEQEKDLEERTWRNGFKKELEQKSSKIAAKYIEELKTIETKVQEGLALSPIFNELKQLQSRFFKEDLSRKDKDNLWKRIDKLFKEIKEKKFGDKGKSSHKSGSRLQSRRKMKRKESTSELTWLLLNNAY